MDVFKCVLHLHTCTAACQTLMHFRLIETINSAAGKAANSNFWTKLQPMYSKVSQISEQYSLLGLRYVVESSTSHNTVRLTSV